MFVINDLETQNITWFGSPSSPFNPANYIVMTGWAKGDGAIEHLYFDNKEQSLNSNWLEELLKDATVYVAHNITFELQWLLHNHFDVFMAYIKRGGRIFCTQAAEYFLNAQDTDYQYAKLEDCAVRYRDDGMSEDEVRKIDEVKILWEQGVLTADIDKALLTSYLVDPVHGDIANTRRVCFKQFQALKDKGMLRMFWKSMDSILFNAICVFNGLHVDMEVANKNLAKQLEDIKNIEAVVKSQLPEMPPEMEFNMTSRFHLSALLFGGTLKYSKKVPYDTPTFVKGDFYYFKEALGDMRRKLVSEVEELSIEHWEDQFGAEVVRYASGKNKGQPKVFREDTDEIKLKWNHDMPYKLDGLIKFADLPSHVAELYIGKKAEYRGQQTHSLCGTPIYSTSEESLDVLAKFSDLAKPLNDLTTLVKDTGTYYIMTKKDGKTSGMLQYVEPNGIVHHQLNNCATITRRLSSSKPNFQNLPRGDGDESKGQFKSRVKEMFTSRFGKDGRIVEVDYTALEVVTAAAITGDKNLLEQLMKGTDMHCYRLAFKEGLEYEDVLNRCKNPDYPDHAEWSTKRTKIKTPSFADQYGASAHGVAYAAGCTLEFAQEFQANEAKLFPQLKAYPREVIRVEVERTGLEGALRKAYFDNGTPYMYRTGTFQAKSGTIYTFNQHETWCEGQKIMDYKPTQIANYPFQGEAAFIVQSACGHVIRRLIENDFFGGQVLPINTVHDAIYLDCATEELAIMAGRMVRDIMAETPKILAEYIPALKDWSYDTVPFPAAAEQGADMGNKHHID